MQTQKDGLLDVEYYKMVTGNQLHPDDPYKVSGIPRSTAKKFLNIMLNIKGKSSVSGAVNKWLKVLASNAEKRDYQTAVENVGDNAKIMDAVLKRNQPIAKCFFKGKAMGQHYALVRHLLSWCCHRHSQPLFGNLFFLH